MSETFDTPETVAEKMKNIPAIIAMWNHYLVAQHDGDYSGCEKCVVTSDATSDDRNLGP